MAARHESSGLHSLASLQEHERRRARLQAEAARARAEAAQRARHHSDREAVRIQQERRLADRAAEGSAESAQREELGRLQAAKGAEFERAEKMVLASADLQAQLAREREAFRGAELNFTARLLHQRLLTCASTALGVCAALAAVGVYLGALRPGAQRALASADRALLAERRARTEAEQNEARSVRRADELAARLASAERDRVAEREPQVAVNRVSQRHQPMERARVAVPPSVKPCRDDGDPLNPCLRR